MFETDKEFYDGNDDENVKDSQEEITSEQFVGDVTREEGNADVGDERPVS